MIKVKAFRWRSSLNDDLPETQLEHYIKYWGISREQIISITSGRSDGCEVLYLVYDDKSRF